MRLIELQVITLYLTDLDLFTEKLIIPSIYIIITTYYKILCIVFKCLHKLSNLDTILLQNTHLWSTMSFCAVNVLQLFFSCRRAVEACTNILSQN